MELKRSFTIKYLLYRSEFRRNSYSSDSISRKHRNVRVKPNKSSENRVVQVTKRLLEIFMRCVSAGIRNVYENNFGYETGAHTGGRVDENGRQAAARR